MVLIAQNDYKPIFQVGKVFYLFNFYLLIKYKVVKLYASDFYTALLSGLRNRTVLYQYHVKSFSSGKLAQRTAASLYIFPILVLNV